MASSLTTFRLAVQARLQSVFGFDFVSGLIEGPVEDRTIGCCWTASVEEWGEDVLLELITVHVRIFTPWRQPQGATSPSPSITDLEDLAEALQTALKPVQTTLGPWQFRLTGVELDLETNGIEGTIAALQSNRFGAGG